MAAKTLKRLPVVKTTKGNPYSQKRTTGDRKFGEKALEEYYYALGNINITQCNNTSEVHLYVYQAFHSSFQCLEKTGVLIHPLTRRIRLQRQPHPSEFAHGRVGWSRVGPLIRIQTENQG